MKAISALVLILVAAVSAAPFSNGTGKTYVIVGQNYLNEWQSFQSSVKTPAGISVYGDIWSGALNSDSQNLLNHYAQSASFVTLICSSLLLEWY